MKYLLYLTLVCGVFLGTGCNNDDDDDGDFGEVTLRHDGANVTGPILPAGQHEFLVRFDAATLSQYVGRDLDRIEFYLGELPAGIGIAVLDGTEIGFPETPGLYFRDIGSRVNATGWVTHRMAETVTVQEGRDLWFSIVVALDQEQRSVGCDAGPREAGGDFLLRETDDDFVTFADITGESVNWNIRGYLAPAQ
jgi:hypothetical protein